MFEGTLVFKNGDVYKGAFATNKIHGFGMYTRANGEVYLGEFVRGRRHGQGELTYSTPNPSRKEKHVGSWKNNQVRTNFLYNRATVAELVSASIKR